MARENVHGENQAGRPRLVGLNHTAQLEESSKGWPTHKIIANCARTVLGPGRGTLGENARVCSTIGLPSCASLGASASSAATTRRVRNESNLTSESRRIIRKLKRVGRRLFWRVPPGRAGHGRRWPSGGALIAPVCLVLIAFPVGEGPAARGVTVAGGRDHLIEARAMIGLGAASFVKERGGDRGEC